MLYTSVPLERIYHDFNHKSEDQAKDEQTEYKLFSTEHGHIHAKRTNEGYVIDHISSTDMQDYLKEGYSVGSVIRTKHTI